MARPQEFKQKLYRLNDEYAIYRTFSEARLHYPELKHKLNMVCFVRIVSKKFDLISPNTIEYSNGVFQINGTNISVEKNEMLIHLYENIFNTSLSYPILNHWKNLSFSYKI